MESLGKSITVIWLVIVSVILYFKRTSIGDLSLNEWGDFLAGVTAPIAFLLQSVKASSDLRNDYKNNSLYVGVSDDGSILCPKNVIDQARAQRNLELARFSLTEEVNFQSKVGKISKMAPNKLPDISKVDSMTSAEYKTVLEQVANSFRNTSKKSI
ncbi:AbiV family abortive infection protein [Vibrio tubiashii]|uniref:AbiV family abortive infection protein n=1 Tax=Vibrio tubiashii TaxID=29498 RepID=UPI001EFDBF42|nr:AbiV family abortive infection protein [Vibrio tubiashii]MCG9578045.1 AbiV family abortive infection protein [Vibrio tubiashii]